MRIYSLIFICLLLQACGDKQVTTYYDNGKVQEKYYENKEGIRHGESLTYFESGHLWISSNYDNGVLVGQRKFYYENGKVEIEEMYDDNGSMSGLYRAYYPSGLLKIEKEYKDNAIEGKLKSYYPSGAIKEDVTIQGNEENGPFVEYYQNGATHWEGSYLNGDNEFGLLIEYDSLGIVIKKMMCDSMATCKTFWKQGMFDNEKLPL